MKTQNSNLSGKAGQNYNSKLKTFKVQVLVLLFSFISFFGILLFPSKTANAQMMGEWSQRVTNEEVLEHQKEEQDGKKILQKLKNKKATCENLTDKEFEKIGDYLMFQMIGDTRNHVAMDNRMKSMMGEKAEEQMHVVLGKRGSGCDKNAAIPTNMPNMFNWMFENMQKGGGNNMMGPWGSGGMMGYGFGAFSVIGTIFWIVILIDLILLGVWLWKQIQKK